MNYTVDGREYNFDSERNIKIKRKLLQDHALRDITELVSALVDHCVEGYTPDYWDNYTYPTCLKCGNEVREATLDDLTNIPVDLSLMVKINTGVYYIEDCYVCEKCNKLLTEAEVRYIKTKPISYFLVDDDFGEWLSEYGGVVLLLAYGDAIWGRTEFGQLIECDSVINKIAFELRILDGQEDTWAGYIQ